MTTAAANSTTTGTLPANLLLRVLGDSIVTMSRGGVVIATQSTSRDNFVGPYPDETTYSVVAGGSAVDVALVNGERALVADTRVVPYLIYDPTTGAVIGMDDPVSRNSYQVNGVVPKTNDYDGIMGAWRACVAAGGGTIALLDAEYDIGANYIPLTSGISYVGVAPVMRNEFIVYSGTVIKGTGTVGFWDGAENLASPTATVAPANATFTSGSANIGVVNSSLFPVGAQVSFTSSANGFTAGWLYFVLSSNANIITVGLADKSPIVATGSTTIQIESSPFIDTLYGVTCKNILFSGIATGIKTGATNVLGAWYSTFDTIYVQGTTGNVGFSAINFEHVHFNRIYTTFGDGQYYAADIPYATQEPGNSSFEDIYNVGGTQTCRHIRFVSTPGSHMNELHLRMVQNNNFANGSWPGAQLLTQQSATPVASGNSLINVVDASKLPVDLPVWTNVGSNPNGYKTNQVFFVVESDTVNNTIKIANSKGGTAVNSTGTTAMNIQNAGMPALEFVGIGTGLMNNIEVLGMDMEGINPHILSQNTSGGCKYMLTQVSSGCHADLICRNSNPQVFNDNVSFTTELDNSSGNTLLFGPRTTTAVDQNSGVGLYRDYSLDGTPWTLNLASGLSQKYPSLTGATSTGGKHHTRPLLPFANGSGTQNTTATIDPGIYAGVISCNPADALQVLTLVTIANASANNTHIGLWNIFHNASAFNLTINTDGTQTFNNLAGKTSVVLVPGASLFVQAAKTSAGTLYWVADLRTPF